MLSRHTGGLVGVLTPKKLDRLTEASEKESIEYMGSFLFPANAK